MNLALLSLAIAAFGIGTTEFVIMGLLPQVAQDLTVTIPEAGLLVTGYALGVAIGAPVMALLTARLPRKTALLGLMMFFIIGNVLCALAGDYWLLMGARVVTSLCHGAFFGIGAVTAASLVPENKKGAAVAMMFSGLTIANVLGVPFGTALGQEMGWRTTFWAVSLIGVAAFAALWHFLPRDKGGDVPNMKSELKALADLRVWLALLTTVLFAASMFTLFTYVAPLLSDVTGLSPHGISLTLLLIGGGLTVGNFIGGAAADWRLGTALAGALVLAIAAPILVFLASPYPIAAEAVLFFWGLALFACAAILLVNAMTAGKKAPGLISTLNIGAFNAGNALGAWTGGVVIDAGYGFRAVPLAAAGVAALALIVALAFLALNHRRQRAVAVLGV